MESLGAAAVPAEITRVELLGHDGDLSWRRDGSALHVQLPVRRPCEHAYALRLRFKDAR